MSRARFHVLVALDFVPVDVHEVSVLFEALRRRAVPFAAAEIVTVCAKASVWTRGSRLRAADHQASVAVSEDVEVEARVLRSAI